MSEPVTPIAPVPPLVTDVAEWLADRALGDVEYVSLLEDFWPEDSPPLQNNPRPITTIPFFILPPLSF